MSFIPSRNDGNKPAQSSYSSKRSQTPDFASSSRSSSKSKNNSITTEDESKSVTEGRQTKAEELQMEDRHGIRVKALRSADPSDDSHSESSTRSGLLKSSVRKNHHHKDKVKAKKSVRIAESAEFKSNDIINKEEGQDKEDKSDDDDEDGKYKKLLDLLDDMPDIGISRDILKSHGKLVEISPNKQFVRYNELLGEGSFKKVYLAYDTKNGFEVAWNVVKMKNMKSAQQARIIQEMKILQTLSHESIMKFYWAWFDKDSNTLAFITEVMSAGTLKDFVMNKPVRLRIIKRWCRHILNALIYLHEENQPAIIHRDLKCDNIFINGSSGEIRIGDLGLASWDRTGNAKSVLGTPEYMAPEMFEENYDEKVDIYAFGMCVLEMVCKETPYSECSSTPQIYRRVMAGEPPQIFHRVKDGSLKDFIWICIRKNPKPPVGPVSDEYGNPLKINKSGRPSASDLKKHPFLIKTPDNPEDEMLTGAFLKEVEEVEEEEEVKSDDPQHLESSEQHIQFETNAENGERRLSNDSLTCRASQLHDELTHLQEAATSEVPSVSTQSAPSNISIPRVDVSNVEPKQEGIDDKDGSKQVLSEKYKFEAPRKNSDCSSEDDLSETETSKLQFHDDLTPPLDAKKLRWVIEVESQDLRRNQNTGLLEFNPILRIYFEWFKDNEPVTKGSGVGADFEFDSSEQDGREISSLILSTLDLPQAQFEKLKTSFDSIQQRYFAFKKKHQYELQTELAERITHFRYKYLNISCCQQQPELEGLHVSHSKGLVHTDSKSASALHAANDREVSEVHNLVESTLTSEGVLTDSEQHVEGKLNKKTFLQRLQKLKEQVIDFQSDIEKSESSDIPDDLFKRLHYFESAVNVLLGTSEIPKRPEITTSEIPVPQSLDMKPILSSQVPASDFKAANLDLKHFNLDDIDGISPSPLNRNNSAEEMIKQKSPPSFGFSKLKRQATDFVNKSMASEKKKLDNRADPVSNEFDPFKLDFGNGNGSKDFAFRTASSQSTDIFEDLSALKPSESNNDNFRYIQETPERDFNSLFAKKLG